MARKKRRRKSRPQRPSASVAQATASAAQASSAATALTTPQRAEVSKRRRPFRDYSHVPLEAVQIAVLSALVLAGLGVARLLLR